MSKNQTLQNKNMTTKQIMSKVMSKCVNTYAMASFGHVAAMSKRYSAEVINIAVDSFPDEYKGLYPIRFLEGIIKKVIEQDPYVNSVSENNLERRKVVQDIVAEMLNKNES